MSENYLDINRANWNERAVLHTSSAFYDMPAFMAGRSSLNSIELDLLGDVTGKSLLHLQCHFGQDTLSLARMGASVTGVDLSDKAIEAAKQIADDLMIDARFVCCDVYSTRQFVKDAFDIVFSSYGTIGWLPHLQPWAQVIAESLQPGGRFVFAEFHPALWMFDDDFTRVAYNYFKAEPIIEEGAETYTGQGLAQNRKNISWNHSLAEVLQSLLQQGLVLNQFHEYDYSPYACFRHAEEVAPGKFQIAHQKGMPLVYALEAIKPAF